MERAGPDGSPLWEVPRLWGRSNSHLRKSNLINSYRSL